MHQHSTRRIGTGIACAALVVVTAVWILRQPADQPVELESESLPGALAPSEPVKPIVYETATGPEAAVVVSSPPSSPNSAENFATERMVAAHAVLRSPAVADPDAETNRQILNTMVNKALARDQLTAPNGPSDSNQRN